MSPAVRLGGERGSVSLLILVLVPALLLAAGLVLDGGRQLQTRREAAAAAAAAARAAVQLSEPELYGHRLDGSSARGRAASELSARGVSGSVEVAGDRVTVTVDETVDYLILPGAKTVSSTSSATALHGVTAPRSGP
jgi:Flp pilus assembly protein TadG